MPHCHLSLLVDSTRLKKFVEMVGLCINQYKILFANISSNFCNLVQCNVSYATCQYTETSCEQISILNRISIFTLSQQKHFVCLMLTDCGPISGSKVRLECLNDIMTLTWPTDVTYNATVTELPSQLKQRLMKRLVVVSQYPILDVVIFTLTPP